MKVEGRIFEGIAAFVFLSAIGYGLWTGLQGYNGGTNGVEPVGLIALTLTGGLCLIIGTYFRFIERRIEPRPEDRADADVSDGAGELGFFSAGSYWPVVLAAAAALGGIAVAFWYVWLIVISVVFILFAVGGLLFEYHTGPDHD